MKIYPVETFWLSLEELKIQRKVQDLGSSHNMRQSPANKGNPCKYQYEKRKASSNYIGGDAAFKIIKSSLITADSYIRASFS
jgi:hypothetical protein